MLTPEYAARLRALSDWMRPSGLSTCPSVDGSCVYLIRGIDEPASEILGITQNLHDTAAEGELLRDQAEGMKALVRAGYIGRFRLVQDRLWQPGELVLCRGESVVFTAANHPTWNHAIRCALRWAYEHRLGAGLLRVVDAA